MQETNVKKLIKASPKKDKRLRTNESTKVWVLNRSWTKDKSQIEVCGAIESIERTIYKLKGTDDKWVRYFDHYHPLHSTREFSEIIEAARNKKISFFNNEVTSSELEAHEQTELSPFIYNDEIGSAT